MRSFHTWQANSTVVGCNGMDKSITCRKLNYSGRDCCTTCCRLQQGVQQRLDMSRCCTLSICHASSTDLWWIAVQQLLYNNPQQIRSGGVWTLLDRYSLHLSMEDEGWVYLSSWLHMQLCTHKKAHIQSYTNNSATGVTYLQFPIPFCCSAPLPALVFPIALSLSAEKSNLFPAVTWNFDLQSTNLA